MTAGTAFGAWQSEVRIDLDVIRDNTASLCALAPTAEVMAVVKGDAYGHGALPVARAALAGGATWLGTATFAEAMELRRGGLTVPVLFWLYSPGLPLHEAVEADVDLSVSSSGQLAEAVAAARRAGRPARVHLKLDTGLARSGANPADWPYLLEEAARATGDGLVEVVGLWSHFLYAHVPGHDSVDEQLAVFEKGTMTAEQFGIVPRYRHIADSAAMLTRPGSHYDLVRTGMAIYGLSPFAREHAFHQRQAMTVRARVALTKRVPAGQSVSYSRSYVTARDTTLALVPLGYADGVPRAASNVGRVGLGGRTRTIAGRVSMDQFSLDCGDDPVAPGDVVTVTGPGDCGEPTAYDWAELYDSEVCEVVSRFGHSRIPRVYDGTAGTRGGEEGSDD